MTDEEFYQKFANGTLEIELFNHSNHVKMGWIYLKKFDLPEAMIKFSNDLKNFAKINGAAGLYHETITFAYLVLINERIQSLENQTNWEDFVSENPDLFDWKNNILKRFYLDETIKSDFAKKVFVFPDRKV